jgi:dihydrofolate synthase/folylpolyglutamate synthase
MREALRLLDNPERKVPTVIVGGTNGKGSVTAMIGNIVRHAEYSVGCYYSPHILDVRERIVLNGRLISTQEMANLIGRVRSKTEGPVEPTYFEFLTLSAYFWFAEKNVDLGVMEVGMGGRFDATNVTDPIVSVITTVSLDHTRYLGYSRENIAAEKVQIVPEGGTLVAGRVDDSVRRVLRDHAEKKGAETYFLDDDFYGIETPGARSADVTGMHYRGMSVEYDDILVHFAGRHQVDNAAVAMATVEILGRKGFSIDYDAVRQGIASVELPGRIQRIARSPEVIVDVAHNPAGGRALAEYIRSLPKKETALVIGMMEDKDIEGFLKEFEGEADLLVLAPPHVGRAASIPALKEAAHSFVKPIIIEETISEAVTAAVKAVGDGGRIVITGSFYTVQEAMNRILDT